MLLQKRVFSYYSQVLFSGVSAFCLLFASAAQGQSNVPKEEKVWVGDPRMGTAVHFAQGWDVEKLIPLIADSGVGWIRDEVAWGAVEKSKGVYQIPPETQKWVDAAYEAGIKIIFLFNSSNDIYDDHYDPKAYAAAAAFVAKELKGKIQAIEILNEPHNFGYMKYYGGNWNGVEADGSDSIWIKKYVELLNLSAVAVKKVNPEIKVIGLGSVSPTNFRQLALGIVPQVDGIVEHPYSYRLIPEQVPFNNGPDIMKRDGIAVADKHGSFVSLIEYYRKQSEKYNGPKEMWLTEWGWSTFFETKKTLYAGFTELAQAKYTIRRFIESFALGVEVSVQYDFKNDGSVLHDAEQNFGLIRADYTLKLAYEAVQNVSRIMRGFYPKKNYEVEVFLKTDRQDPHPILWETSAIAAMGTARAYQFANEKGEAMLVLWNAERADGDMNPVLADVELKPENIPTKVKVTDILTDTTKEVPFVVKGKRVVLEDFIVPDTAIAIRLE